MIKDALEIAKLTLYTGLIALLILSGGRLLLILDLIIKRLQ